MLTREVRMNDKAIRWIVSICIPVIILLGVVLVIGTNNSFVVSEIEKGIIDNGAVSKEQAVTVAQNIHGFLKDDTVLDATLIGVTAAEHMVDVKALYDLSWYIFWGLCLISCILVSILFGTHHSGQVPRALLGGGILTLFMNGLLLILITFNFSSFWTSFHGVMFSNELWKLNPQTDALVAVFTEQFFIDFIVRSVIVTTGVAVIILALSSGWLWLQRKPPETPSTLKTKPEEKGIKKVEDTQW